MNMENLLIPRYRVEQDYPDSDFEVGMIITFGGKSSAYTGVQEWETVPIRGKNGGTSMRCIKYFEPFPNIFRPLHWWEFRDESEMPEYVQDESGEVWKVFEYKREVSISSPILSDVQLYKNFPDEYTPYGWHNLYNLLPATEQQYLTYINSK